MLVQKQIKQLLSKLPWKKSAALREAFRQQQHNLELLTEELQSMRYGSDSGMNGIPNSPEATILTRIRMAETEMLTGKQFAESAYEMGAQESAVVLTERMAELELALEDRNWLRLAAETNREFSRQGLRAIQMLSRLFYLKNPLINRGVEIKALYVWGQGVSIDAKDEDVNDVIQDFIDEPRNRAEMWGHQARRLKEVELEVTGNLFFVFFVDRISTGKVRMASIPADEVMHIHTNPEDMKEPWFYERMWTPAGIDPITGAPAIMPTRKILYPDWRFDKSKTKLPAGFEKLTVQWDTPVYHVKVGSLPDMRFGTPETYAALDWARAYKEFLEDWASITKAHTRFAWSLTTKGGRGAVDAHKSKLNTTTGTSSASFPETNPPATVGSTFIGTEGVKLDPIKTAGAQPHATDAAPVGRMVGSALGIPETMLMEDVAKGSHATAKTLDRPTELLMRDRQELWIDVISDILNFVIDWAGKAPNGALRGKIAVDALVDGSVKGNQQAGPAEDVIDRHVDVDFPQILQLDVLEQMQSLVMAVTLNGQAPAGSIPDMRFVCKLALQILGQNDIDELLDAMFPDGAEEPTQEGKRFIEAIDKLTSAVKVMPQVTIQESKPAEPAAAPVVNVNLGGKKILVPKRDEKGRITSVESVEDPVVS